MNTYVKYCPNVWLAKCDSEHQKGEIIKVANKYGKENDCEVHNLVVKNANGYFYSVTRCDGMNRQTYAQIKAEKYKQWALTQQNKSNDLCNAANEGKDFLVLGEPIKVGHHSEKRHRALIERNNNRMTASIEASKMATQHESKADYWQSMKNKIDLSMPESVEYFAHELQKAEKHHSDLKTGKKPKLHSYSLTYAAKDVKEISKKLDIARKLWS